MLELVFVKFQGLEILTIYKIEPKSFWGKKKSNNKIDL